MKKHILIIEDEPRLSQLLQDYLKADLFDVSALYEGTNAIAYIKDHSLDLILLDIMLPGKSGVDICKEVRAFSQIPIIMTTAKVDEIDRLIGLEIGADDYICKPYSPREVVARVKAVLRRVSPQITGEKPKTYCGFEINLEKHRVTYKGELLQLTPNEFALFDILFSSPGRVYKRDELLEKVMGYEFEGYDRTIDSQIKKLRKNLLKITKE
ncbi:MAG: response regulator, partial [Proteobacteria bacterium]|nr:response regulator [Pseudomonadota bacterium]